MTCEDFEDFEKLEEFKDEAEKYYKGIYEVCEKMQSNFDKLKDKAPFWDWYLTQIHPKEIMRISSILIDYIYYIEKKKRDEMDEDKIDEEKTDAQKGLENWARKT